MEEEEEEEGWRRRERGGKSRCRMMIGSISNYVVVLFYAGFFPTFSAIFVSVCECV